jgi:hypothetical protein
MSVFDQQKIRTQEDRLHVPSRPLPFDQLLVTATTSGAAQTFYTVRALRMLRISRLVVANVTGTAATLTLHAIPSGGTIGNGNIAIPTMSIAANTAVDLTQIIGGLYQAGAAIKAFSGTGSALVLHGSGEELL